MRNLTFKAAMLKGSQPTVNRRSTDGQSQRHCKQTPLSKRWKVLMTLVFLFTLAIGNVWADTTYKLFCGATADVDGTNLNTADFWTGGTVSDGSNSDTYSKCVKLTSNVTGVTSIASSKNFIAYDVKTTATTIQVVMYNKNNSDKKVYFFDVKEKITSGKATASYKDETIKSKTKDVSKSYSSTNDGKATIYITSAAASDAEIYQVIVTETGTPLTDLKAGYAGYSLNLNKGRAAAKTGEESVIDGLTIVPSSDYKPTNNSEFKLKTFGTHYISFTAKEDCALKLTVTSGVKYTLGSAKNVAGSVEYGGAAGTYTTVLEKDNTYFINPIAGNGSDFKITKIEFVPVYTLNFLPGEGTGSMEAKKYVEDAEVTLPECTFTYPGGTKEFASWQVKDEDDDDVTVTAGKITMPDKDVNATALWAATEEKYTVTYKDGEQTLKSVNVAVGSAPDAYSPTKDCYSFAAWQKDASDYNPANLASDAEANQTYTLTARWTPVYASGTYNFEGKSVTTSTTEASVVDGALYFSDVSATLDTGDPLYYGWKLKTKDATVKFLVQNNSAVKLTLKEANPLDITYTPLEGAETTESAAKSATKTVNVKGGTIVTLTTTTGSTTTLNKLEILPLYNATYTTSKSSVDPTSASNVTEVTLPTPSETTVGGYSFTGWVADKTVYDDEENEKTAGADLTAGKTYTLTATTEFTAQWALISDFDVKFFQGYGDPDVQIGDKQTISTGNFAVAPSDPTRDGYNFKGWSYDATEANIVNVAEYAITAATNFTAIWKQVFAVTFDGAGSVNVESGSKVASPDSPSQAGKVFQGWYNGESKYDFSAAVTANLALTSKWADADANHYVYAYNDDFHFDGVVYKTPEGKTTDPEASEATLNMTTPYTLFSGTEGISSIVATKAIYDYKKADNTKHITAYLKLKKSSDDANSKLIFTIASGYTAVLKVKMGGYSKTPTVTLKKGDDAVTGTPAAVSGKAEDKDYAEITYNLVAGVYEMTTADQTLYFSHIDLQATALPTFTVTYVPGEGTGDEVVDNDATMVADCPAGFTAPTGKAFNGWKDGDNNDVEVGATVTESMTLTAQWINQYAVTFDMQGHGSTIATQYIKHGAKATKPADPFVMGWDFGGWFTEATCENEFDFNAAIEAATPLFAKWTEFIGCTMLYPAKSGDAIAVGDPIVMQEGSHGAAMTALAIPDGGALNYTNSGLAFATKTGVKANVVLSNDIVAGTKIILTLVAGGEKTRGLFLYTKDGDKIDDFTCWVDGVNPASNGLEDTFTYTVQAGDGLEGTNEFQLWRNNTVYLKSLKVSSCGDAIIYHDLTSEVNIAGKGTVTLGANTVREGHTTTATYSDIDPLYEFVSWSVSGTGASIENATANPATITMGTEDAVVTLNLKVKPVKFTVNYYDGTTLKGTEEVTVNEYPTAAGIETAKAHYIFEGWAESPTATAADVIDLATLTSAVAATFNLYAIYTHVPCVSEGTVFSMSITDPEGTEYNENNNFGVEIGATYVGGKAYSGSKSATKRIGYIDANGEYAFENNGDVTVKIAMDCALAEGDVILFTNSNTRQLKIQKVAGSDLYTTSNKKFTIPAESSLIGAYDFYLERGNSASTFKTLRVERPYTISFDLQGHGTAIAAVKQIKDEKISAPAAPTADGWDFGGWYKEAACTNAWDFDNDVVDGTATLFAKWSEHVYNDATLKSLTYGGEEIALEDGIYEYNIELPALTTAVPALAAETNSALATKLITNAESFDGDGKATSRVEVTSEDHTVELTYIVNFTKIAAVELQDVTGDFTWDFSKAVSADKTVPTTLTVLANIYGVANNADFKSDNLMGASGKMKTGFAQVKTLKFHATVPGKLTVVFSNTGNKEYDRILYINGVATTAKSKNQTHVTYNVVVPAGDVLIQGWETKENPEDETWNMLNFYSMDFDEDLDPTEAEESTLGGYERDVNPQYYGTVCLPKAGVMTGAMLFQVAYMDYKEDGVTPYKVYYDEVENGIMQAGMPYIFLAEQSKIGVYYTATAEETAKAHNGLHGTLVDMLDMSATGIYMLYNNQVLHSTNPASNLPANRAYLKIDEIPGYGNPNYQAPAPKFRRISTGFNAPQVATGIDELNASEAPVKVLINGQIFILRGEKLYDVTGKLVK